MKHKLQLLEQIDIVIFKGNSGEQFFGSFWQSSDLFSTKKIEIWNSIYKNLTEYMSKVQITCWQILSKRSRNSVISLWKFFKLFQEWGVPGVNIKQRFIKCITVTHERAMFYGGIG